MRRLLVAGVALALAAATLGHAEVSVGDLRSVQAKTGVALRQEPAPLAATVAQLPYGTRAHVLEVRGGWARVQTTAGTGWLRGNDLVEPATLTGGGARGPTVSAAGVPGGGVTGGEVAAAGRQFDEATEGAYQAANPNLAAAYAQVAAVESRKPTPEEVAEFIRQGRLGR
jgi:hypothetical protein